MEAVLRWKRKGDPEKKELFYHEMYDKFNDDLSNLLNDESVHWIEIDKVTE